MHFTLNQSCRSGDLESVKYWVEEMEVDVNVEDFWNATPLYYACLCGNYNIVEYLLVSGGARCELKTFQGERCYYAASTDQIRNLLMNEKVLTEGLMRSSPFYSFCQRILHSKGDTNFSFAGPSNKEIFIHNFFLRARGAAAFSQALRYGSFSSDEDSETAELLLEYLYTARVTIPMKKRANLVKSVFKYNLNRLHPELAMLQEAPNASTKFYQIVAAKKNHSKVRIESTEGKTMFKFQLYLLLQQGLSPEFVCPFPDQDLLRINISPSDPGFDLCLTADGMRFYAHKVMLINRSEYFATLIKDTFEEHSVEGNIQLLKFRDIRAPILACVLYHVYTEDIIPMLNMDTALEVLNYGMMWLLPGLVKHCANFLCQNIAQENVIPLIKTSRLYNLYNLESFCVRFLTVNLESCLQNENCQFRQLVLEDAQEIENRETIDSIPVIDDIHGELRKHETEGTLCAEEIEAKRTIIQAILLSLNLQIVKLDELQKTSKVNFEHPI